jgi:uncharacterized protein (TIGR02246 family)
MAPQTPKELAREFAAAINRGDVQGAVALWVEEAVIIGADGSPVAGREQVGEALAALIGNGTKVELHVAHLFTAGDLALVSGTLTMTVAGETPFTTASSSMVIYRRQKDGSWRIAIDAPWGLPAA